MSTLNVATVNATTTLNTASINGGQIAGFRNCLINGNSAIWQRGTTNSTDNTYMCDRWKQSRGGGVAGETVSQQTGFSGSKYCMRVQRDNGNTATNAVGVLQDVETLNSLALAGKNLVISFDARKGANFSAASDLMYIKLQSGTGTDQTITGGYTGQIEELSTTLTLTGTATRFSVDVGVINSLATQVGVDFGFTPVGTAGAADYLEITNIQLELGSIATPFEREDIGTTLAKCLRYGFAENTGGYAPISVGQAVSTTRAQVFINLPVQMRAAPTLYAGTAADYDLYDAGGGGQAVTAVSNAISGNKVCLLNVDVASGLTAGNACQMRCDATGGSQLFFDAEL